MKILACYFSFFSTRFFTELRYSYVKRTGNKVAYNLARHAFYISNFVVWIEDVPSPFLSVVQVDTADFS